MNVIRNICTNENLTRRLNGIMRKLRRTQTRTTLRTNKRLTISTIGRTAGREHRRNGHRNTCRSTRSTQAFRVLATRRQKHTRNGPLKPGPHTTRRHGRSGTTTRSTAHKTGALLTGNILQMPVTLFNLRLISRQTTRVTMVINSRAQGVCICVQFITRTRQHRRRRNSGHRSGRRRVRNILTGGMQRTTGRRNRMEQRRTTQSGQRHRATRGRRHNSNIRHRPFNLVSVSLGILDHKISTQGLNRPLAPRMGHHNQTGNGRRSRRRITNLHRHRRNTPLKRRRTGQHRGRTRGTRRRRAHRIQRTTRRAIRILSVTTTSVVLNHTRTRRR